jgi:alpha-amylase
MSMWIPPATKGAGSKSNGYDVYDIYDLEDFQQKGAKYTKWRLKEELVQVVNTANSHGIGILFDAVLNHKAGADRTETIVAVKVDPEGSIPLKIVNFVLGVGWLLLFRPLERDQ